MKIDFTQILPAELIFNIFFYVDYKHIPDLRLINKQSNTLINSTNFWHSYIRHHQQTSYQSPRDRILLRAPTLPNPPDAFMTDIDMIPILIAMYSLHFENRQEPKALQKAFKTILNKEQYIRAALQKYISRRNISKENSADVMLALSLIHPNYLFIHNIPNTEDAIKTALAAFARRMTNEFAIAKLEVSLEYFDADDTIINLYLTLNQISLRCMLQMHVVDNVIDVSQPHYFRLQQLAEITLIGKQQLTLSPAIVEWLAWRNTTLCMNAGYNIINKRHYATLQLDPSPLLDFLIHDDSRGLHAYQQFHHQRLQTVNGTTQAVNFFKSDILYHAICRSLRDSKNHSFVQITTWGTVPQLFLYSMRKLAVDDGAAAPLAVCKLLERYDALLPVYFLYAIHFNDNYLTCLNHLLIRYRDQLINLLTSWITAINSNDPKQAFIDKFMAHPMDAEKLSLTINKAFQRCKSFCDSFSSHHLRNQLLALFENNPAEPMAATPGLQRR